MKKTIVFLAVVFCFGRMSFGDVGVVWYNDDNPMAYGTNAPADWVLNEGFGQLYWATNATPWTPVAGDIELTDGSGTVYTTGVGTVYVLDSVITTGSVANPQVFNLALDLDVYNNASVAGNAIASGYLYSYLFGTTNLVGGSYYFISSVVAANTVYVDMATPSSWTYVDAAGVTPSGQNAVYTLQLVPEPSSLGLCAVGALIVGVARRRRTEK